jgi:hypothetical protein
MKLKPPKIAVQRLRKVERTQRSRTANSARSAQSAIPEAGRSNPMHNSLTVRRVRYLLAGLALVGVVLAGAACTPTKAPPPAAAVLTISPTSFDYGEIETGGGTDPITFTVTNDGSGDSGELDVTIEQPDPTQFKFGQRVPGVDDTCSGAVLASGESCTVGIEFAPTSDGSHQGTLVVSADPGGTASAPMSGTAVSH